jgi:dsDNA-specific endonuclease/ATPase MutS2
MSSNDIFRTQINYFKKMLESAITNEYDKVTFIHGVGNGVLKNAIIEELKHYDNTSNRMASIMKFGVGAIDVMIKEKEA